MGRTHRVVVRQRLWVAPTLPGTTMTRTMVANRGHLELIEAYYEQWRKDPEAVDKSWGNFFEGYDLGQSQSAVSGPDCQAPAQAAIKAVTRLVDAYREMGHYLANLDPLKLVP